MRVNTGLMIWPVRWERKSRCTKRNSRPRRCAARTSRLPESVVEHGVNIAVAYGFVREFKRAALAHLAGGAQEGSEGGTC
jgi:hypothetical protein